ncbi:MAG: hypothetical protein ACR2NZ_18055 [Rubripirellula sp.]
MFRIGPFLALLCAVIAPRTPVLAQLTEEDRSRLISGIESAEREVDVNRFPSLTRSKADVLDKIDAVHRYFEGHTDAANRAAWLRYLKMEALAVAIESEEPAAVLARETLALHDRLLGMTPGLELTALRNLRSSTEELFNALLFRNPEDSQRYVEGKLKEFAAAVKETHVSPTPDEFSKLSTILGLIDASGQAPHLVEEFRNTFGRPNLAILIGKPLVEKAIRRDVTRSRPVRDCILGTRITGTATLNGVVTASLVPSVGDARVQLLFSGQVVSQNRGYNKPVRLRTIGNGDVTILRGMTVSSDGIHFEPADTTVALRTTIQCIQHPLAIVRNIAWKSARRQKPQADRIATERMRVQVTSEFETETGEVSPMTPTDLLERVSPTLKRLSLKEPNQIWSSSEQAIAIDSLFRGDDQLASIVPRPSIEEPFDAAVQIHESVIENAFTTVLAGRTLDEKRLSELLAKAGRPADGSQDGSNREESVDSTDEVTEGEEKEQPFEISFSRARPIIFEARDQTVRLGVSGTRFAQGQRVMSRPLEITAVYKPETLEDGAVVLQRHGKVEVSFSARSSPTMRAALRPVIEKSFTDLFPQTILERALKVPTDAKIETLRGTDYRPHLIQAQDGWLTIAIR